jgi:hypothetical protein
MHHWTIQVAEAWSKDGSNISSSTETRNTLVIAIQFRDQKITIGHLLCFSCRSEKETGYPMLFKCLVCQCLGIRKTGLCRFELDTSSTAQGGGGSFKNRKPIGKVGGCESGMAERSH